MSFHHATTFTDYARTAVDLRIHMAEYTHAGVHRDYLRQLITNQFPAHLLADGATAEGAADEVVDVIGRGTRAAWVGGESFVLAPAMTAIVAAAAEALDLTGDLISAEVAPCDSGVLLLPEPIYHRRHTGTVAAIGAITWTSITTRSGQRSWLIASWSPLHDPDDPNAAKIRRDLDTNPQLRGKFGPYLMNRFDHLPVARPVEAPPDAPSVDDADLDWQSAPDGRYILLDETLRTQAVTAILYAFWRIQAQPIAVAAPAPVDRPARRRAARASIVHNTRVVMLRRTSPLADRGDGDAKWHYRVRFPCARPLAAPGRQAGPAVPGLGPGPHQRPRRRAPAARREGLRPRPLTTHTGPAPLRGEAAMGFQHESTLAGYARAATDARIRMAEYTSGPWFPQYVRDWIEVRFARGERRRVFRDAALADFARFSTRVWQTGQSNVVAPAMTAILAAAASALDLTGEVLTDESAPDDHGVVFFPEPIYQRDPDGGVHAVGALTWTRVPTFTGLGIPPSWMVASWSDLNDAHDPNSATIRRMIDRDPGLAAETGPYLLVDCDLLQIGVAPSPTSWFGGPDEDLEWQTSPDGRCVIDTIAAGSLACSRLVYAYWRISSQPLATVATPPLDRPARRRAARASIVYDTRVVMLRRTSPVADRGDGEAKWHYRVRFVVKGHWRRLVDKQGQPYRVWVQAHIKGPDGAPLLLGEKVAVLAR